MIKTSRIISPGCSGFTHGWPSFKRHKLVTVSAQRQIDPLRPRLLEVGKDIGTLSKSRACSKAKQQ